jgi:hypothetical protein
MSSVKIGFVVIFLNMSVSAFAAGDDAITPYRPTVSNSAALPVAGQMELELGGLHGKTNEAYRDSLPYLFKLAFNPDWGILLGGEALVSEGDGNGNNAKGFGDTTITLKRAFAVDDKTGLGLEFGMKMPSAKNTIGNGKSDFIVNGVFSRDIGPVHMDANINLTRFGAVDVGTSKFQTGLSAAFSTPLSEKWSAIGELSGTRRNGTGDTAQFLTALTYSPTKRLTLDFGFARGLTSASQHWAIFTGLVIPIGNFW